MFNNELTVMRCYIYEMFDVRIMYYEMLNVYDVYEMDIDAHIHMYRTRVDTHHTHTQIQACMQEHITPAVCISR